MLPRGTAMFSTGAGVNAITPRGWTDGDMIGFRYEDPNDRSSDDQGRRIAEEAQEEIGQEVLMRVDELASLRADIELGRQELGSGQGRRLEFDDLLQELHGEYAAQE